MGVHVLKWLSEWLPWSFNIPKVHVWGLDNSSLFQSHKKKKARTRKTVKSSILLKVNCPFSVWLGSPRWMDRVHTSWEGWWDSMPEDAKWQLHQSHGGWGQRRLGHEPQAFSQGGCTERKLSQGYTALPHGTHHTQVSNPTCVFPSVSLGVSTEGLAGG